jgi:molecular chaperone DnaJ
VHDHYRILGLRPTANLDKIRAAYRQLVRAQHPDASGRPADHAHFAAITEAYRVLTDPARRRRYDAWRAVLTVSPFRRVLAAWQDPPSRARWVQTLQRQVRRIFAAAEPVVGRDGEPVRLSASVSFADAYRGGQLTVDFQRLTRCRDCGGLGSANSVACPLCGGKGRFVLAGPVQVTKKCPKCDGAGYAGEGRCRTCQGRRRTLEAVATTLRCPAGVSTGVTLRAPGQGHQGVPPGGDGDLLVEVTVAGSLHFDRRGLDLVAQKTIPLADALLGGKAAVALPDDTAIEVTIPADVHPGKELRTPGLGFVSADGHTRGDLVLLLDVYLPEGLGDHGRYLAAEWFHAVRGHDAALAQRLAADLRKLAKGNVWRRDPAD